MRQYRALVLFLALIVVASVAACRSYTPASLLPTHTDRFYRSPDGKASLEMNGAVRLLRLSGSHYEMGYNHGYLLAPEIMNVLTQYGFWVIVLFEQDYADLVARQQLFAWGPYAEELRGMLAGMRDALAPEQLLVSPPGQPARPLALEDLMVMNAMGDWLIGSISCSSFSIWGEGRRDRSALLARNFDWMTDAGNTIMDHQVVIAYQPDDGPRWVNVTFTGEIGCVSGMNEYGVSAMIHVVVDPCPRTDREGFVPGTVALRRVIEQLGPQSSPADVEKMLDGFPALGAYTYHVVFPTLNRTDDEIAGAFEYDGRADHPDGRCTWRRPSDNPRLPANAVYDQTLPFTNALLNANHYLKRKTDIPLAFSSDRYLQVKRGLLTAKSDGQVDREESRAIMASVGFKPEILIGRWSTLHTVIFEPDAKRLRLHLAADGDSGYEQPGRDFRFEDLFD